MLRVRQIPFIMGLPAPKTTLPPNCTPLKIPSVMTLMESWLRQFAMTDFTGQDKKTGFKSVWPRRRLPGSSWTSHIISGQQVLRVAFP